MKALVPKRSVVSKCCAVLLGVFLLVPAVLGGQNDLPGGAQEATVSKPGTRPVWWEGSLNNYGDVDWYWFELKKPITLELAFEKPAHRQFFCRLYSADNTENPIGEAVVSIRGEVFAGYESIPLEPGKYYLKIWGEGGDFSRKKDETYKYALAELPSGKSKSEMDSGEEQELKPEDVERLLDALQSEEEDRREIEMREEKSGLPEVLKDW